MLLGTSWPDARGKGSGVPGGTRDVNGPVKASPGVEVAARNRQGYVVRTIDLTPALQQLCIFSPWICFIRFRLSTTLGSCLPVYTAYKLTWGVAMFVSRIGKGLRTVEEVPEVHGTQQIASLNLHGNEIAAISGLHHLESLTSLNLSSNSISVLSGLSGLQQLTHLNLASNHLQQLSGLEGLPNLAVLNVSYNYLTDISGLTVFHGSSSSSSGQSTSAATPGGSLQLVNLQHNNLSTLQSFAPLAGCLSLRTLKVGANPSTATAAAYAALQQVIPQVTCWDSDQAAAAAAGLQMAQAQLQVYERAQPLPGLPAPAGAAGQQHGPPQPPWPGYQYPQQQQQQTAGIAAAVAGGTHARSQTGYQASPSHTSATSEADASDSDQGHSRRDRGKRSSSSRRQPPPGGTLKRSSSSSKRHQVHLRGSHAASRSQQRQRSRRRRGSNSPCSSSGSGSSDGDVGPSLPDVQQRLPAAPVSEAGVQTQEYVPSAVVVLEADAQQLRTQLRRLAGEQMAPGCILRLYCSCAEPPSAAMWCLVASGRGGGC
jgi:hypothetical protein